jgi:hypothetical protein
MAQGEETGTAEGLEGRSGLSSADLSGCSLDHAHETPGEKHLFRPRAGSTGAYRGPRGNACASCRRLSGAISQAVLPLLNTYARIPVSGLIAQYNGVGPGNGTDRLPATTRETLSKSLTLRGFITSEFAGQYYDEFLRDVGAGMD